MAAEAREKARSEWLLQLTHPLKTISLPKTHFLFARLQHRRQACEEAFQLLDPRQLPPPLQALPDAIKHLYQSDTTFMAALCDGTVQQRTQLLKPRMTCLLHDKPFYVVTEATQKLRAKTRDNKDGRHDVVSFKGTHIKPEPDAPGYEAAVSLLNQQWQLSLTSVSRLGKLCDDGHSWPVLVSKTVKGESLKDWQGTFDPTAFVDSVFFHLVIRPYDGKADNFIVEKNRAIGIDNDLSFTDTVVRQRNGEHLCNIHYALFFHPQMGKPIPDVTRKHWRDPNYIVGLVEWIHNIERHEAEQREQLLRTGLFNLEELRALQLPTRFPKGAMAQTLRDLLAIQSALSDPAVKTPFDVLKQVNPAVYVFYRGYQHLKQAQPLEAMEGLDRNRRNGAHKDNPETPAYLVNAAFTFETLARDVSDPELQTMAKTLIGNWQNQPMPQLTDFLFDESRRYSTLGHSQAEMWEAMDLSKFSAEVQSDLLDMAMTTTSYPYLTLRRCSTITDKKLAMIIKQHPHLTELTLINGEKITIAGLQTLLKERPLSLTLSSQDMREGWAKLAILAKALHIQIENGMIWTVAINGKLQKVPAEIVDAIKQDRNANQFAETYQLMPTPTPSLSATSPLVTTQIPSNQPSHTTPTPDPLFQKMGIN